MEGAVASWSIETVLLSQVPKFGIGSVDNAQNANRLCRHSSTDHSRLVIRKLNPRQCPVRSHECLGSDDFVSSRTKKIT
jgi:hypothetical protein